MKYYIQDDISNDYYYTTFQDINDLMSFIGDIAEEYGDGIYISCQVGTIVIKLQA